MEKNNVVKNKMAKNMWYQWFNMRKKIKKLIYIYLQT